MEVKLWGPLEYLRALSFCRSAYSDDGMTNKQGRPSLLGRLCCWILLFARDKSAKTW